MNRSEIESSFKRELLGLKWIGNTTEKESKLVGPRRGLFGVHLLIRHFKLQFSKTIKSWTYHNFFKLNDPLRKDIRLFPKIPRNLRKTRKNCL